MAQQDIIKNVELTETQIAQETFKIMTSKLQFTLTLLQFFQDSDDGEIELWKLRQLMEHFGQPTTIGEFFVLILELHLDHNGRTYYQDFIGLETSFPTEFVYQCPDDEPKERPQSPRKLDTSSRSPQSPSKSSPKKSSGGASPRRPKFFERSPFVSRLKKMFKMTKEKRTVEIKQESNEDLIHVYQAFDPKKTGLLKWTEFEEITDMFSGNIPREKLLLYFEKVVMENGQINYDVLMNLLSGDEKNNAQKKNPEQVCSCNDEEACNVQDVETQDDEMAFLGPKLKKLLSSSESKWKRVAIALRPYSDAIGYFIGCDKSREGMLSEEELKQVTTKAVVPDHVTDSLLEALKSADDDYFSIKRLIKICGASLE